MDLPPSFPAAAEPAPVLPEVPATLRGPWNFWATFGFGVLAMLVMVLAQTVVAVSFLLLAMLQHGKKADAAQIWETVIRDPLMLAVTVLTSAPAVGLTLWLLIWLRRGPTLRDYLGLRGFRIAQLLLWTPALAAVLFSGAQLLELANDRSSEKFMIELMGAGQYIPLLVVAIVIGAPLAEELLFRGFMYRGMVANHRPVWLAILVPNILWTMLHVQYDFGTMAVLFCIGIVFGCARHFSRSTLLAVLLHLLNNGFAMLVTLLTLREKAAVP